MPYVERDSQNNIIAVYKHKQPGIAEERLADDDVELIVFYSPTQEQIIEDALADTETIGQVARKVEDLIDHIINGTTLDPALEQWRAARATKRQSA